MWSRLLLNLIISQSKTVTGKPLVVRPDALLVLHLSLHIVNGIRASHFQSNSFTCKPLVVRWDALLVLDLSLRLSMVSELPTSRVIAFTCKSFDKDLHAISQMNLKTSAKDLHATPGVESTPGSTFGS